MAVFYLSAEQRTAYVSVNGGPGVAVTFPPMGSWDTVGSIVTQLALSAGSNTIKLYNPFDWVADVDRIGILKFLGLQTREEDRGCGDGLFRFIGHSRVPELTTEEVAAGTSFQGVDAWVPIREAFLCEEGAGLPHSTVTTMVLSDFGEHKGWVQAGYEWQDKTSQTPQVKRLCRIVQWMRDKSSFGDLTSFNTEEQCQPDWSPPLNSWHQLKVDYLGSSMRACVDFWCFAVPWNPADPPPLGWGTSPVRTWMPRAFGEVNFLESDIPGTYDNTVRFTDFRFQLGNGTWTTNFGRTYSFNDRAIKWHLTDLGVEKTGAGCPTNGIDDRCFHIWVVNPRV